MAKKKNRSLNIERKRTKRKRNQKSRRKQLAVKKQRLLQNEKSDEERLQERIIQSRLLLDEPEFDSITFDLDLMRYHLLSLLESSLSSLKGGEDVESESDTQSKPLMEDSETIGERFRQEVLPRLITPDFLRKTSHAFKACETRLGRIGQREKAEVALVARSLFELAEPETLAFHPLILKVGARTLEQMLGQPEFMSDERRAVEDVLSDVLNFHISDREAEEIQLEDESANEVDAMSLEVSDEPEAEPPVIAEESSELEAELSVIVEEPSEPEVKPTVHAEEPSEPEVKPTIRVEEPSEPEVEPTVHAEEPSKPEIEPPVIAEESSEPKLESTPVESVPAISPTELPAKALYKNFNGLETRKAIEAWNGYRITKDMDGQVEFAHPNLQHYITLTEERLLLQCASDVQLLDAMEEVEKRCGQALFYLARTFNK
jgi:hypothetical protein